MKVHSPCFAVMLVLCTTACSPEPEELGATRVDSLMIEIMVDIHLINARAELGYGLDEVSLDTIITRHGLSRKEYDDQITFYTEHPDTYLAVSNKVMERIGQDSRIVSGY